jgi:hypothetical protein
MDVVGDMDVHFESFQGLLYQVGIKVSGYVLEMVGGGDWRSLVFGEQGVSSS